MQVRALKEEDYDQILVKWWRQWRWTPPAREMLPDNGRGGFIIYDGDVPVVAGFLYQTNSKMAWVEWVISDFDYKDKDKRKEAISMLLAYLEGLAKAMGKKALYSLLKSKPLIEAYKLAGYESTETGYTEMIKRIWE
jgi:hypothetical protein